MPGSGLYPALRTDNPHYSSPAEAIRMNLT